MQYRHEVKYEINYSDMMQLSARLDAVAKHDPNAKGDYYFVRSLYFDNNSDKALKEKLDGVKNRNKFRIRYYNGDTSVIHLEKKCKRGEVGYKEICPISPEEVTKLLEGDYSWMPGSGRNLVVDLYTAMTFDCLRPKSIVDYTRKPYIYPAGNVRITFDYDIRTSTDIHDFLDPFSPTLNTIDSPILLEIKWDNFLPDIIKDCTQLQGRQAGAFSKYAASRMYD